ncbi:MAG: hypothetical protein JXQ75_15450 [Phycisphaerae bacterium]|nr:hypothetical protein [Phycisphaerae bacterium]
MVPRFGEDFAVFRLLDVLDQHTCYTPEAGISISELAKEAGCQPADVAETVEGLICGCFGVLPASGTAVIDARCRDVFATRVYIERDPFELMRYANRLRTGAEASKATADAIHRLAKRRACRETGALETDEGS